MVDPSAVLRASTRRGIDICAATLLCFTLAHCSSSAVGVDACRQIETARCNRVPSCQLSVGSLVYTSGTDVQACVEYYDVACLHGLTVSDPGNLAVNACVTAIQNGPCSVVTTPGTSPSCAWLGTPASVVSDDAESPDALDSADAATALADATTSLADAATGSSTDAATSPEAAGSSDAALTTSSDGGGSSDATSSSGLDAADAADSH